MIIKDGDRISIILYISYIIQKDLNTPYQEKWGRNYLGVILL